MARRGDVIENPITSERITFLKTAEDTDGALLRADFYLKPGGFLPGGVHTHPYQEERFEVNSGALGVRVGRRKHVLKAGQAIVVPPGVIHSWWNAGAGQMEGVVEFRPALDMEGVFESSFALARDGQLSEKGLPHPLQAIALLAEYGDELGVPGLPHRLQRAIVRLLAPLTRKRGYRGRYHSRNEATASTAAGGEL
ncbi:MAG: cupin domain-containing protein [Rubrobacteraceae bacterium]